MDDPRYETGMPILDRQGPGPAAARPGHGGRTTAAPSAGGSPRSVPEARPTPLQRHYVLLSAPALVLGAVAITALEIGASASSPLVKLCVLVAAPLLAIANADAIVRVWRSAWAWMPVDRGLGLFRLGWTAAAVVIYVLLLAAAALVVAA